MSLILEALRKSEAERQRGRAPGLFVEQVATRPAPRARMPAWAWALAALLVATLALLAWREGSREERGQVQFPSGAPNPSSATATTIAAGTPPTPEASSAAAPPPRATLPTDPATVRTPEVNLTASPTLPPDSASSTRAASSASVAPAEALPLASGPAAAPPEVNLTPFSPPSDPVPTLASLDAGTRAQLPPLKLSMHVYAEVPAQRFVILDGQRLGEGASPGAGIVLEEIRREGLVISVNGQRLLLARP